MKTIKELYDSGKMSARLYNGILRRLSTDFRIHNTFNDFGVMDREIGCLTPKDVLDMYSEKDMMLKFRSIGKKSIEELKGLC